ncbi:MAG TPA: alpha/beta hydrolase-fold protein [Saprospiraceae bacterium]|nr:alpha/beta hydrolase-fold protein [Saprospiraceae bacterium]
MKAFTITLLLVTASHLSMYSQEGTKERIQLYSKAIEGNLIGDPAERDVTVYLPPSYLSNPGKRYPVLYMLHGFTDSDSQWFGWENHWINLHTVINQSLSEGLSREMIVVMPNAYNRFKGSMYASSVTIGDWETFIVKELVNYIDSNFRTLAHVKSRGLAGHSMGGYGTIRLGMKHPDIFSSIYLMSPCCLEGGVFSNKEMMEKLESFTNVEQLQGTSFFEIATLATSAAFAPNPSLPPFYLDLPFAGGELRQDIVNKITANRILYMIDSYVPNMKTMTAIALDAGLQDYGISDSTRKLHEWLNTNNIPHLYESYEGDHLNRIAERIRTHVLPFFSEHLVFE